MIALLDTSEDLDICERELGCKCEQLLTPLTRFVAQRPNDEFAIDNGSYSIFDPNAFRMLLEREEKRRHLCRFVAVPDVVGSAIRTWEAFQYWSLRIHGWRLAYVAQDGQESIQIPWDEITAIFIGGSTDWKLSKHVKEIIKCAQVIEKWVHVGRINTPGRFEYFEKLGVNSIDGTGLSRYSWMREQIHLRDCQLRLIGEPLLSQSCF